MKIDWKRKLSSRKFWAALIGFIVPILVVFNIDDMTIEQVTAIVAGAGTLIAYILSEGYVDGQREKNTAEEAVDEDFNRPLKP